MPQLNQYVEKLASTYFLVSLLLKSCCHVTVFLFTLQSSNTKSVCQVFLFQFWGTQNGNSVLEGSGNIEKGGSVHQLWSSRCSLVRCYYLPLTSSLWTISLYGLNFRSGIVFTVVNAVQNLLPKILIPNENAVRKLTKASGYKLKWQKTEKDSSADQQIIVSATSSTCHIEKVAFSENKKILI